MYELHNRHFHLFVIRLWDAELYPLPKVNIYLYTVFMLRGDRKWINISETCAILPMVRLSCRHPHDKRTTSLFVIIPENKHGTITIK